MAMAILTKYLGPTDHRGVRIKAWSVSKLSVTILYPHELSGEACHWVVLAAWLMKHRSIDDWMRCVEWVVGETMEGYVFVPVLK